jgi:hypothetical protein
LPYEATQGHRAEGNRIVPTATEALALSVPGPPNTLVLDWSLPLRHQTF